MHRRFAIVALAVAAPLLAQTSAPVDPAGVRLTPGIDSMAIYLVRNGDTTRTGTVIDEVRVESLDGQKVIRRVYVSVDRVLGARDDTLVDRFDDLRPLEHRSHTRKATELADFAGERVRGWLRPADADSVAIDSPLGGAYNASSLDLVLRASSLRDGWTAEVPVFVVSTRSTMPVHARVADSEPCGGATCWRVEANFGGAPVTFWIDQRSRALRQQVMTLGPGMALLFRPASETVGAKHST